METVTEILNQAWLYIAAAIAFASGLVADFKSASKWGKVSYLVGGVFALFVFLTLIQWIFG